MGFFLSLWRRHLVVLVNAHAVQKFLCPSSVFARSRVFVVLGVCSSELHMLNMPLFKPLSFGVSLVCTCCAAVSSLKTKLKHFHRDDMLYEISTRERFKNVRPTAWKCLFVNLTNIQTTTKVCSDFLPRTGTDNDASSGGCFAFQQIFSWKISQICKQW